MIGRLSALLLVATIILLMFFAELALEFRHFKKGYHTLLLGSQSRQHVPPGNLPNKSTKTIYGPALEFPFRSKHLNSDDIESLVIWVASSSHAEHSNLAVEKIFPNLICTYLSLIESCAVINGSKAGMSIDGNIRLLEQYAHAYSVDYVIFYQMSLIIEYQQGRVVAFEKQKSGSKGNSIINVQPIKKWLQRTAAYQQLSDYIGGNIKMRGFQHDELPAEMRQDFYDQIMRFVNTVTERGAEPILVTFAASHNRSNIHAMHHSVKTNFVRYNNYLSVQGWLDTIEKYNDIIRDIAIKNNIKLIDVAEKMDGQFEYFVDFVHFNEQGHTEIAAIIATELSTSLATKK